ncbi:hypothetical protein L1887_27640 [Cichorium endivia]|nr:hypothetical protein L1887_27640 [Cichorium endivia]
MTKGGAGFIGGLWGIRKSQGGVQPSLPRWSYAIAMLSDSGCVYFSENHVGDKVGEAVATGGGGHEGAAFEVRFQKRSRKIVGWGKAWPGVVVGSSSPEVKGLVECLPPGRTGDGGVHGKEDRYGGGFVGNGESPEHLRPAKDKLEWWCLRNFPADCLSRASVDFSVDLRLRSLDDLEELDV